MFKIIRKCIGIFILSVVVVNIIRPLFRKTLDEEYKETEAKTEYESDEASSERIMCIDDNEEALLWRLRMIGAAKESIVLTTFDLRDDNSGTDVMAALYDAADRGVKVQLLIDGIYEIGHLRTSDIYQTLISHENVEVRIYNPLNWKTLYNANYRMHDKYLIVDESIYLLGGRNTSDIFLGNYKKTKNVDREILVYETVPGEGESLKELQEYFDRVWDEPCVEERTTYLSAKKKAEYDQMFRERYELLKETYEDFTEYEGWMEDTFEVNKITLISNGTQDTNKAPQMLYAIEQLALQGGDVLIQTPYVIANQDMYGTLEKIASVADLKIMINAVEKGSNPWGCTDYLNNKTKILSTGAEVYEVMNEQAVHTKTVLIDDNISIVGSYNFDMRSTYLDTELMLVIDSEELNAHLREMTDEYAEKSIHVLSDGTETVGANYKEKEMTTKKKITYSFLRIIIRPFRYLL